MNWITGKKSLRSSFSPFPAAVWDLEPLFQGCLQTRFFWWVYSITSIWSYGSFRASVFLNRGVWLWNASCLWTENKKILVGMWVTYDFRSQIFSYVQNELHHCGWVVILWHNNLCRRKCFQSFSRVFRSKGHSHGGAFETSSWFSCGDMMCSVWFFSDSSSTELHSGWLQIKHKVLIWLSWSDTILVTSAVCACLSSSTTFPTSMFWILYRDTSDVWYQQFFI